MENNAVSTLPLKLPQLLDNVWHGKISSRDELAQCLSALTLDDWQVIAAWDAGATLGLSHGQAILAEDGKFSILGESAIASVKFQVIAGKTSSNAVFKYEGTDVVVACKDRIVGGEQPITRDPVALILALEYIRDGLDTSSYLPREMVTRRLSDKAKALNLSMDYFMKLLHWFPAVEAFIKRT